MSTLETILATTRATVAAAKARVPMAELERRAAAHRPRGWAAALRRRAATGPAVIAEIKKASPSKGMIRADFDVAWLAGRVQAGGAAGLSVLTDEPYFQGSLRNLEMASAAGTLPCLRKDFTVDAYQIVEARAHCADAILLIAAALRDEELRQLAQAARELELDVLVEVHTGEELDRVLDTLGESGADAIGVNNRDLKSFAVNLDRSFELVERIPALWTPSANYGAGEPRFVFYSPLTWMLGAALGLGLPWHAVPVALTFLLLAGTGLASRALAGEALCGGAATLAGCAALFSGYALFTAYERSAFAELAGGFWIPLVLLFALRNRNASVPGSISPAWRRALDGSTAPLALAVAGAWLSNPTVGVMACYLLAAVALVVAPLSRSWAPVLRAAAGAVLGMGLAAIYLVPAAWEQRWVDIHQVTEYPGQMLENNWLFARHADPSLALHDAVLHTASIIAVIMIAAALSGLLVSWLRGRLPGPRRFWVPLALIPLAVLFLQFPLSRPVWNLLPELRFLQFPWRWLVVLEAPMAILPASAVWPRDSARPWRRTAVVAACAVVFLAMTTYAGKNLFQSCDGEDAVPGMLDRYHSGQGFAGTDEYEPLGADNSLVASGLPAACLVSDPSTALGTLAEGNAGDESPPAWSREQGSCEATFVAEHDQVEHVRIAAVTPHAGFLILRLRSFPAWRVTENGRSIAELPQRDDGLMAVPVPQGPVDLAVDWTTTPDVLAGRWLSGAALLLLIALWLNRSR